MKSENIDISLSDFINSCEKGKILVKDINEIGIENYKKKKIIVFDNNIQNKFKDEYYNKCLKRKKYLKYLTIGTVGVFVATAVFFTAPFSVPAGVGSVIGVGAGAGSSLGVGAVVAGTASSTGSGLLTSLGLGAVASTTTGLIIGLNDNKSIRIDYKDATIKNLNNENNLSMQNGTVNNTDVSNDIVNENNLTMQNGIVNNTDLSNDIVNSIISILQSMFDHNSVSFEDLTEHYSIYIDNNNLLFVLKTDEKDLIQNFKNTKQEN